MMTRKGHFLSALLFSSFFCLSSLQAQSGAMSGTSSGGTITPSRMGQLPPLDKGSGARPPSSSYTPSRVAPPAPVPQQATYFHPGILVYRGGAWQGGDHLLNITNNIGVYVTIIKPEGDKLDLNADQLRKQVETIFSKEPINPTIMTAEGQPPLPFFQIQILLYPIDKGYVACCEGRLFESVMLQRFMFDPGMGFQAITWEKQTLQVGPTNTIIGQIQDSVDEIAQSFVERYDSFDKIRKDLSR
ncbi:hypothetical protein [Candidatus Protochlamydia phocaeensis]|uniref:hypothetical protein n=1 Tax=Candidatus Protochlamydia phocaeensis TaxID=1414722 RepID=UPI000838429E|nr:hypothetical protein [Candidatus Protochlamydia phocaeensis]